MQKTNSLSLLEKKSNCLDVTLRSTWVHRVLRKLSSYIVLQDTILHKFSLNTGGRSKKVTIVVNVVMFSVDALAVGDGDRCLFGLFDVLVLGFSISR